MPIPAGPVDEEHKGKGLIKEKDSSGIRVSSGLVGRNMLRTHLRYLSVPPSTPAPTRDANRARTAKYRNTTAMNTIIFAVITVITIITIAAEDSPSCPNPYPQS
ncbi:hypothetical protein F5B18DRAFT_650733 [Nemania serpens]|nr:hypothetical protein F5B18DRAFT_650733 [Nemania serpens]